MPHVIEHAKTGRAKCRGCGQAIAAGVLRLGERVPNPFSDDGGETTHWFHLACAAFMRPETFLGTLPSWSEAVEDRERLEREAHLGMTHRRLPRATTVERAPSGRAACRACKQTIDKGTWRIALMYYEDGRFAPSGSIHVSCAPAYLETADVLGRLKHFTPALGEADLSEIQALLSATPAG
jgi:ribosomal protein L37AE/L43A